MKENLLKMILAVAALAMALETTWAHGLAGKRFFPATLTTDDPFVADEMSLPTFSTIVAPEDGGTRETEFSVDIAKTITPWLGVEIGTSVVNIDPTDEKPQTGLGNLELGAKFQFLKNAEHEAIMSVGFDAEIGGTGTTRAGAVSFSTWTPTLFFGKGMGDLPDCLSFLKPTAITGTLGFAIPSRAYNKSLQEVWLRGGIQPHLSPTAWCEFGISCSALWRCEVPIQKSPREQGLLVGRIVNRCQVAFIEWTDGHLRHCTFIGRRDD